MIEPTSSTTCAQCDSPLDPAGDGSCPRCLMLAAMQPTEGAERQALPSIEEVRAAFPQLEILGLIGQGGMGCVFKARQPTLDRLVALKLLPASLAERDAAFAGRFEREGQLLARLHHPNIVAVHDSGKAGAFFYLLMEYVDGVNLREAMRAGRFTPAQALAIVPRVCDALQFAHDEGVLHRDIKPENILLDAKGRVKLVDFGIAKLIGDPADRTDATDPSAAPSLTQAGAALGTPSYMAPEQRDTPADVDHRADIYSLGVVFYELLTGELPAGSLPRPSAKSDADPRVDAIVQQALEKERDRRQHSAGVMKTQVETIASSANEAPALQEPAWLPLIAVIAVLCSFLGTWPSSTTHTPSGGAVVKSTHIGIGEIPLLVDTAWHGHPLVSFSGIGPLLRPSVITMILATLAWALWLSRKSRACRRLDSILERRDEFYSMRAAGYWAASCALALWMVFWCLSVLYAVATLAFRITEWPLPLLPLYVVAVLMGSVWAWKQILAGKEARTASGAMDLASPANPLLRRFGITAAVIGALMVIAPPVVRWLRTPDIIPPGTLSASASTTQGLRDGKWKRTWRIRAGGDMIWQAVGMPQLLPISRMGRDHPNGSNHSMNVDLALADLGGGKVRITQTINGHSASVDAVAKIEDLIREAGPDVAKLGRVLHLANLSVAPLVLARIDDESMLPNGTSGIADPVPRPASNLYLHIWQTAPSPGRLVLTRRIFPNVASEDMREHELIGRLEARRGSDSRLTYTARFHSLGNQVGSYEGSLELDRPVIYETRTDHRCGYAVLTTNPVADQQQFPPIERWSYFARNLTRAGVGAWMDEWRAHAKTWTDDVGLVQDTRGAFTLTGSLENVRSAMTMLRLIDQPEVKDLTQLPSLNMPPEFFLRTALPALMLGTDFAKAPLTAALRDLLQKEGIAPAQLSRALIGHVIEVERAAFKDSGPPLDSIKHTPGASTFYDVTIPCLDLYDGSGFPTKELTFRIERTVQPMGTQSRIADIAPWLIAEAKKLPATTPLEK